MKKNILSMTLLTAAVAMMSLASCDNVDDYNSNIHDPVLPEAVKEPVKLNLPSGTQWAPMNLGAQSPYDYGTFYAWDANLASQVWGNEWTLPTREQVEELFNSCTWENVSYNGKSLVVGTSKYPDKLECGNCQSTGVVTVSKEDPETGETVEEEATCDVCEGKGFNYAAPAKIYISLTGQILPDRTAVQYQGSRAYFWTAEEGTEDSGSAYYMYVNKGKSGTSITCDLAEKAVKNAVRCVKKQ